MSAFSIQIDATQLVYQDFIIPGITSTWISARTVQTLSLGAGEYGFQIASGYYADFRFLVTAEGTVDYNSIFDKFLAGKGGSILTITGFPVTLDARNLSGSGILLVIPSPEWIAYRRCRMVPASYLVQQGSGEVTSFSFKLGLDGNFSYNPSYDINQGGFLAGNGTSTLQFIGYPILVDARTAEGAVGVTIQPIWGMPFNFSRIIAANLLPAPGFALQFVSGQVSDLTFTLDVHGQYSFDSSLSKFLQLQNLPGGRNLLKVLPPPGTDLPADTGVPVTGGNGTNNAPIADQAFLGSGIAFPVRTDALGHLAMNSLDDQVHQSILLILATVKGERMMRPDFGAGLQPLVFSPATTTSTAIAEHEVREALIRFEPRIEVLDVQASSDSSDVGKLLININYRVRQTDTQFNLVYPFYLERGGLS